MVTGVAAVQDALKVFLERELGVKSNGLRTEPCGTPALGFI